VILTIPERLAMTRAGLRARTAVVVMSLTAGLAATAFSAAAYAEPFTTISSGQGHTCATRSGGAVECWGHDYVTNQQAPLPTPVPGIAGATAVATGFHFNCALLSTGAVACWGDDGYGQLGNGKTEDSAVPVNVLGISNATAISVGAFHACALLTGGAISCWGRNAHGALGNDSTADSSTPVAVSAISNATAISAGYKETCAVLATGGVDCWGSNYHGQLGNGTRLDSSIPVAAAGITNAAGASVGGAQACAVLATGKLDCWGDNRLGELGVGRGQKEVRRPVEVGLAGQRVSSVSATSLYTCAVLTSGAVDCWGINRKGTLGIGHLSRASRSPVQAHAISNAASITTSNFHACALLSTGAAMCWGSNDYGELGAGLHGRLSATPLLVL
jgi:alpha-tubulin suppressor-like RCC1 family protein